MELISKNMYHFCVGMLSIESGKYNSELREILGVGRVDKDSVAIYLPSSFETWSDLSVLPNYFYLMNIPSSVTKIIFSVELDCLSMETCKYYADTFLQFLGQAYPRAEIDFLSDTPTSREMIHSILFSEYVIINSIGWRLLPIAMLRGVLTLKGDARVPMKTTFIPGQTWSNEFYQILSPFQESTYITSLSSSESIVLSEYEGAPRFVEKLSALLNMPPTRPNDCKQIRGRLGHWERDMSYAKLAQYKSQLRHYSGQSEIHFRRQAKKGQYRPSTTYRWKDEFDHSQPHSDKLPHCPFELVTLKGFCSLLERGDIRRVFFLGDSLMLQQAQSLWKLLDQEELPTVLHSLEPNFKHTISCPDSHKKNRNAFTFDFQFIRNDKLIESPLPVSIDSNTTNCGKSYCYPWFREYTESPISRTLMIANFGPHIVFDDESGDLFERLLNDFISNLEKLNESLGEERRGKDLVFFRTSVPGHFG